MKITLKIDPALVARLRREAARQGRTMSEIVETALRRLLNDQPLHVELPPLLTFHGGGTFVDITNRDQLYEAMEERQD